MADMPEISKVDTASQMNQQMMQQAQAAQQAASTSTPANNVYEAAAKSIPYGLHDGTFAHLFKNIPLFSFLFKYISQTTNLEYDTGASKATPLQDMDGALGQHNVHGGVLAKLLEYFTREFNMGEAPGHGSEAGDATAGIQHAESGGHHDSGGSGGGSASSGTGDIQALNFGGAQLMDATAGIDTHVRIEAPAGVGRGGGGGDGGGFSLG